jgi:hypothetical protein
MPLPPKRKKKRKKVRRESVHVHQNNKSGRHGNARDEHVCALCRFYGRLTRIRVTRSSPSAWGSICYRKQPVQAYGSSWGCSITSWWHTWSSEAEGMITNLWFQLLWQNHSRKEVIAHKVFGLLQMLVWCPSSGSIYKLCTLDRERHISFYGQRNQSL